MSIISKNLILGNIAAKIATITVSGTNVNFNLYNTYVSIYGTPSMAVRVDFINNGTLGATLGGYSLTIGQFPVGSRIRITNNGNIFGAGGAAGSGNGGNCIYSVYSNQEMILDNKGNIFAGGGGGGSGGVGGQGFYYTYPTVYQGIGSTLTWGFVYVGGVEDGGYVPTAQPDCNVSCTTNYGTGSYCTSCSATAPTVTGSGESGYFYNNGSVQCGACYVTTTVTNYTIGGSGGSGGRGQGYDGVYVAGTAGAPGGINAGIGGNGGGGGGWGLYGGTGSSGFNGNYTSGTSGSSGGAPGYWIFGYYYLTTFLNSGTAIGLFT